VPESGGAATPMQALLDEVRKTGDDRSELAMKVGFSLALCVTFNLMHVSY